MCTEKARYWTNLLYVQNQGSYLGVVRRKCPAAKNSVKNTGSVAEMV